MLRRHGSNIGDEDEILENNVEIDEDNDAAEDGTIMRNTKPKNNLKKFHRSSSRVNGTSETINKQSSSNNFTSSNNKNQDPKLHLRSSPESHSRKKKKKRKDHHHHHRRRRRSRSKSRRKKKKGKRSRSDRSDRSQSPERR